MSEPSVSITVSCPKDRVESVAWDIASRHHLLVRFDVDYTMNLYGGAGPNVIASGLLPVHYVGDREGGSGEHGGHSGAEQQPGEGFGSDEVVDVNHDRGFLFRDKLQRVRDLARVLFVKADDASAVVQAPREVGGVAHEISPSQVTGVSSVGDRRGPGVSSGPRRFRDRAS